MNSVSHSSELVNLKQCCGSFQICSQFNQAEVPLAWGPHLQLSSEVRAVLLGTLAFSLWDLVLTPNS